MQHERRILSSTEGFNAAGNSEYTLTRETRSSIPDAPSRAAAASRVSVELAERITRAVLKLWRLASETDDLESSNDATDSP